MAKSTSSTKTQKAYEKLRKMIIAGKVVEKSVSVRSLAQKFGMSVVPVYGALKRLEQEGLITVKAQSGISVRTFTDQELREVYVVREGLEIQAIRIVTVNQQEKLIHNLEQIALKKAELVQSRKYEQAALADFKWHETLVKGSKCHMLIEHHGLLMAICLLSAGHPWQPRSFMEETDTSPDSHMRLVAAIKSGDPNQAEQALRDHIRSFASTGSQIRP